MPSLIDLVDRRAQQKNTAAVAKAIGKEERRLKKEKAEQEAEAARKKAEEAAARAEKRAQERRKELWDGLERIAAEGRTHRGGYQGYLRDLRRMDPSGGMTFAEHIAGGWEEEKMRMLMRWNHLMHHERTYFNEMEKLFG